MIDLLIVVIVLASINLLFSIFNIVHRHYLKESDALVWIAVLKENAELKTNASRNNSTASMRSTDCPAFMPSISHKEIKPQITKTNAGILKFISITHTAFVIVSYSA